MRRVLAAVSATLTTVALLLTVSCSSDFGQGPAGRVVAKESEYECRSTGTGKNSRRDCRWEYELTTRDSDGQEHEFEVPSDVYDKCRHGSAYPACTHR